MLCVHTQPTPSNTNTFECTSPQWAGLCCSRVSGAVHGSGSALDPGDSTSSYHEGMMVTDRCRGGREEDMASDRLEQDHSSLRFEGSQAGTHKAH